ncbi:MAG: LptF/LptG family permease [Blastocatellia bacterium]|nr:LptF/LptG family permease [Blastocatellia bacterium]
MHRLIDRYLLREIVPYLLLSLILLTAIIFSHDASRFSELLVVASRKGLPMEALWRVLAALIPGILIFTLPISLLIGTLVGLGRLSGDTELVALGASGVSRLKILKPVVALGLAISAIMLYLTFNVLPRSIRNLNDLKANQSLIFQGLNSQIKPRVFEESFPKKVLYIEDIDRAQNIWHNIFLVDIDGDQDDMKIWTATSGSLRQGEQSEMPEMHLRQVITHQTSRTRSDDPKNREQEGSEESDSEEADSDDGETDSSATPSDSSQKKGRKKNRSQQTYTAGYFAEMTLGIEVSEEKKDEAVGAQQKPRRVEEMEWGELLGFTPPASDYLEWRAEVHKRIALPVACLVFALLGVGFGISNVRTGRSFGLLLGLAITIVYYLLALTGQHAAVNGRVPVWLGLWLANIILTVIGVLVILVQRRPGSDALSAISSLRHIWLPVKEDATEQRAETRRGATKQGSRGAGEQGSREAPQHLSTSAPLHISSRSYRLPQLIDRLVLSDLARFFFYILGGFSVLFIIITLFQLLNSITRNNIEWTVVANYLLFLLPMIVNYMVPLAALVAVLVTFGILQKTSQVVALKASGQSIYRLAAPVVLLSVMLSGLVFLNQDYILPFTNSRQNNLRHLIRSGQEPPQTFYQTTNQWIFGSEGSPDSSRIYNYAYFDMTNNAFARLNVLDLSREPFGIKRRLYARRAAWDSARQEWVLENGWERRFEGERLIAYEHFKERREKFPERPDYFKKDSRGSSSMTLVELRRKIEDLSQSGFDVLDLKIALQSKIAFPLACLIMVLVGLPFSFSVGKRGALYGVALGIGIGLCYWGLLGLFEQMGRYEMLPPILAAWGPNMLFGTGGLYLLLTSRT